MLIKKTEELIGIMKNTGKVFHTGYMYRYNPCIMELMEEIEKQVRAKAQDA